MTKRLLMFSIVGALTTLQAQSLFWQAKNTHDCSICYCADLRLENSAEDFLEAIDSMPHFLDATTNLGLPIIVIAPEELGGFSPLADEAPALEGARTALTWTRAYYQALPNGYDVRIIRVPHNLTPSRQELITFALKQTQPLSKEQILDDYTLRCIYPYTETLSDQPSPINTQTIHLLLSPFDAPCPKAKPQVILLPTDSNNEVAQRYLVAGGSGFIGYHVVKELLQEGHRVVVVDNNVCSSPDNLTEFLSNPRFIFVNHDITLPFTISGSFDAIINLASIPSPAYYYKMPLETLRVGLQGNINLLQIAQAKHARYIFTSTSEVYGDPEVHPQPEDYPGNVNYLGKRAQYDQSKRGAETLLKLAFKADPTLDIRIARLFNTYGPYMMLHDGRVVTNFIAAIIEDKSLMMYGDGNQTRSFGYVEDTVNGIMCLVHNEQLCHEPLITNRAFNLGTPYEFTINELSQKVAALCEQKYHRPAQFEYRPQIDKTDPSRRLPDITRAHNVLGFNPQIRLEEGLEKTWAYFEKTKTPIN